MNNRISQLLILAVVIGAQITNAAPDDEQPIAEKPAAKGPTFLLRGEVVDVDRQLPLAARISVKSANGSWYFPKSASPNGSAVEYKRQVSPTSLEQHVTLSAHPFEVELPEGTYIVTVERGKEYVPLSKEITIAGRGVDIKLPLRRWIHMAKDGWYSGDVHAHRPLSEVPNLVLAEDLNVAMPLSHWVTAADTGPVTGNRIEGPAPRPEWIALDPTHGIYPLNTEYEIFTVGGKSHTLGAVLILGQSTTLNQGIPPVRRIAEKSHREGAFLDLEKHSWAWTPMIVPLMKPDLFELANNHCWPTDFAFHSWTFDMAAKSMQLETNSQGFTEWGWIEFGLKSYYAYLNCGFRMMPSAGTGSGVHPVPLGFGRVYAHVDGDFTFPKWRAALLAGRSFVTTGPLMRLTFNGHPAGHTFQGGANGTPIRIVGSVSSLAPLDRVEILVNGVVSKTIHSTGRAAINDDPFVTAIDETIQVEGSGWIAVRSFDSRADHRIRFAHTSPVFVEVPGQSQAPFLDEVDHFIERIEREIERHRGVLDAETLDEYQEALAIYRDLRGRAIERPNPTIRK